VVQRTSATGRQIRNKILSSIPEDEFRLLQPHLEFCALQHHSILYEPHRDIVQDAYFQNAGMVALVVATQDGQTVEVGVVGNEGMVGMPSLVGVRKSPAHAIVQIGSEGFRVKMSLLQATLKSAPRLQEMLNRYAVLQGLQAAQTAACNRWHSVEQRLARWLLVSRDKAASSSLPITHDFLATMLGTDRPSVSLAAAILQKKKAIEYSRGAVMILNRKKLQSAACECYEIIQEFM
jgi:CRP-like cAMP-binding protein